MKRYVPLISLLLLPGLVPQDYVVADAGNGADVRLRGVPVGTVREVRVGEEGRKAVAEISLQSWGASLYAFSQ